VSPPEDSATPGPSFPGVATNSQHGDQTEHVNGTRLAVVGARDDELRIPWFDDDVDVLTAALAYAAAGWYLAPVKRGTKHPGSVLGTGWQLRTSRDPEVLVSWFAGTDYGIALHAGRSGAVVFDVDTPSLLPAVLSHAEAECHPPTQYTRADDDGDGRRHLVFAMPPGRVLGNGGGGLGEAWGEVRGANGVIIVEPTPHPDGGRYRWIACAKVPELPEEIAAMLPDAERHEVAATSAEVGEFARAHNTGDGTAGIGGPLTVFARDAGGSRHKALMDAACWLAREARAGAYSAAEARKALRDAFIAAMAVARPRKPGEKPDRVLTPAEARKEFEDGWAWAVAQALAMTVQECRNRIGAPVAEEPVEAVSEDAESDGEVRPTMRDRLLSVFDLGGLPPVAPLIRGLLYRGTLAQMSGPPGSYKSFVMLAWAISVALGRDFGHHRVGESGPVVIVAAEGATGLQARILAFCELNGIDPAETVGRLYVLPEPVQIDQRRVDISEALVTVAEVGAVLLVLDTRARCTVGLEENSSTEQGHAIAGADRIVNGGCTVLTVHHAGRNGGPRGSNAWDGAVWSDLRLTGGGLMATVGCHKHKDVPDGCEHLFRLIPHVVSEAAMPSHAGESDQDWTDRRTTLVAAPPGLSASGTVVAKTGQVVRDVVRRCAGAKGLTRPEIVRFAEEKGAGRSQVYEAINTLLKAGVLVDVGTANTSRFRLAPGIEDES
jgi:hypothetical protein